MKVAFLFSGQYRNIPNKLFQSSITNLVENINYGIFCYSWDEIGESLDHGRYKPKINSEVNSFLEIKTRFKDFNLVNLKTESYKEFKRNISKNHLRILNSKKYHRGTINSLPQIYTLSKCYELFLPFQNEYDLVFRCRFDSIFIHPLDIYPLTKYIDEETIYNLNFGRAYYPSRVYDIFFGGSPKSMRFIKDIWSSIPFLVENEFNNKQDKRDACRLIYLSAHLNKIKVSSLKTRICDIYRPFKDNYYERYLISSHLISLKIRKESLKSIPYIFKWFRERDIKCINIFISLLKASILIFFSYLKRIKYFL